MNPLLAVALLLSGGVIWAAGLSAWMGGWLPPPAALAMVVCGVVTNCLGAALYLIEHRGRDRRPAAAAGRRTYEHRQTSALIRLVMLGLCGLLVADLLAVPERRPVSGLGLLFLGLLAAQFERLTIRIRDGELQWTFGLFGFPTWRVKLDAIAQASVTRTRLWEGWGIHRSFRGWVYNIAGFDAVLLKRTDGRSVVLGTDQPRALLAAIERAREGAPDRR